jgi:SAM-dependent methyltransferase
MTSTGQVDLDFVVDLYETSLQRHGTSAPGVGWRDATSHLLRHRKLAQLFAGDAAPFTLNDLGCGYGSFYEYLKAAGAPLRLFRGYDISEKMLAKARERITAADIEWRLAPRLDAVADYTVASGIFNVRQDTPPTQWRDYILVTLDNMNEFSTRGFAFNLLTTHVDWQDDKLYYGDPLFFFEHCRTAYSRQVALLHDYPLWEWTILVRKPSPASSAGK